MALALEIKSLTKKYPNGTQALQNISLNIKENDFFALLGSNGAGKTTTINIVCGLLKKTSGNISVLGLNQEQNVNKIKSLIGLMGQEFNFSLFEPIEEILINQAGYYGIDRRQAKIRANYLLEKVRLFDKRKQTAKDLSGGMKRRLMLARSLMHKPKVLILDEPTAGVDIEIRLIIWEYLQQLNQDGTTIILTTHYLEEAEKLCKNIAIIDNGKVLLKTNMKSLLKNAESQTLILESHNKISKNISVDDYIFSNLDDYSLKINLYSHQSVNKLLAILDKQNVSIYNIRQAQNKLESLFVNLTKK